MNSRNRATARAAGLLALLLCLSVLPIGAQPDSFRIEKFKMAFSFPEGDWAVFTQDTADDDPNLSLLGEMTGSALRKRLKSSSLYLDAILPDLTAEITVSAAATPHSRKVFDLNLLNQQEIEQEASGLLSPKKASAVTYESYEEYTVNDIRYLRFLGHSEQTEGGVTGIVQYTTIFNGYNVSISYLDFNGTDAAHEQLLKQLVDSLQFDERLDKTFDWMLVLSIGFLIVAVGGLIFSTVLVVKAQKKKRAMKMGKK